VFMEGKATPKAIHFVWRLVRENKIPTKDNLARRGVQLGSTKYVRCDQSSETIRHICSLNAKLHYKYRICVANGYLYPNSAKEHSYNFLICS